MLAKSAQHVERRRYFDPLEPDRMRNVAQQAGVGRQTPKPQPTKTAAGRAAPPSGR